VNDEPEDEQTRAIRKLSAVGLKALSDIKQRQRENPDYQKNPPRYRQFAEEWAIRDIWTVLEAANLFAVTSPGRPYPNGGALDEEVNRLCTMIFSCVGSSLKLVGKKPPYFRDTRFERGGIDNWAEGKDIDLHEDLVRALGRANQQFRTWTYTTEHLDALQWVVNQFWEGNPDHSTVPRQKEMVEILEQKYGFSKSICKSIDQITRHPAQKKKFPKKG
jgi:hypothetical protein